jgi:hypothetical protein
MRLNSVPAKMLLKLPTIIGFAENQLSRSVLSFTILTIILRISLQRYTVRTFIILIIVRSPGFGSNIRCYLFFLIIGLTTRKLATNVNLVTHYTKGTFLLKYLLELLIKLLLKIVPSRYYSLSLIYII